MSIEMTTEPSHLTEMGACSDAVAWVKSHKFRTLESAWKECADIVRKFYPELPT